MSCAGTAPCRSVKFGRHQAWSNRTIVLKFGRNPTRGVSLAGSRARGTLAIGLTRGAKNGDIGRNRSDACSFPGLYLDDRWSQRDAVATDRQSRDKASVLMWFYNVGRVTCKSEPIVVKKWPISCLVEEKSVPFENGLAE